MKKPLALAALALALVSTLSCEQRSWEETKMFNQKRHLQGHGDSHGEAKAGHAAPAAGHATPAPH